MLKRKNEMRKILGMTGLVVGMLALIGVAGHVTELGPEAGINEALNVLATLLVTGCLINLSWFMVDNDV
jgi:uncharacterized membrane protein (UPF0136 family)